MGHDCNRASESVPMRQRIKDAFKQKNYSELFNLGLDSFFNLVFNHSRPFQEFLFYTSDFFDQFIISCCKNENLNYVGGTFTMQLGPKDTGKILLSSKMYFKNRNDQWVQKEKIGATFIDCFSDWDSCEELKELSKKGILEFPIEPPIGSNC